MDAFPSGCSSLWPRVHKSRCLTAALPSHSSNARRSKPPTYETVRGMIDSGDYAGFADLFAEDGTFVNSTLPEPVRGREAIRTAVSGIPPLVNREEWVVIDGNRLVFC